MFRNITWCITNIVWDFDKTLTRLIWVDFIRLY